MRFDPRVDPRFDPEAWALVHDRREPRHLAFWRGLELCAAVCAERVRQGALWADVGCGTGHLSRALSALGACVVGLDHDLRMTRYARRRGPGRFAVAAASSLALRDGSCAGLVAISLFGCLPGPAGFLAEAARVLAPGGTLCLSAMNRHSLLLAASKPWSWRPGRPSERYAAYDPAALAAALRRAAFEPERQILYGHFASAGRLVLPGPGAAQALERTVPPGRRSAWARQLLLVARRR
jgi:SAM-dependent methyltransferase